MKHISPPPFRKFALNGLLVFSAVSAITMPAYSHEPANDPVERTSDPCVSAASGTAHSSASAEARSNDNRRASTSACAGTQCTSSGNMATERGGLSGSSTLPDGSSVTVHSHNGTVSSSTVTGGSSGRTSDRTSDRTDRTYSSSASAGASQGKDCVKTIEPHTHEAMPDQKNRKMEK